MDTPWHEGERALQARAGVAGRMAEIGPRAIRQAMPDQHRSFFAQLPFILAGYKDKGGDVWASLLSGSPGFVTSPDPKTLVVAASPVAGDPLAGALQAGLPVGMLGIEWPTRRRNRANGRVSARSAAGFTVLVEESFGNCPKYIERRDYLALLPEMPVKREPLAVLDASAQRLISGAAAFFVASSAGGDALPDVSHRGGPPGFIRLEPDGVLTIPDYAGNFFFNTLGNILLNPRAGLLFPDFRSGDVLQLTGMAWLVEDGAATPLPGAKSLWRFRMTQGHWLRGALPLRLAPGEASPFWP